MRKAKFVSQEIYKNAESPSPLFPLREGNPRDSLITEQNRTKSGKMNPLIILTSLAVWSAASSYSRYKSQSKESEVAHPDPEFEDPDSNETHFVPSVAASSGSSIHSPSSYLNSQRQAQILSFARNIAGSDSDSTSFTTSNGITSSHHVYLMRDRPSTYRDENGNRVQNGGNIAMSGHTSHTSPEGTVVSVTWNAADEDRDRYPVKSFESDNQQKSHEMIQAETYRQARQASLQYSSLYGGSKREYPHPQ